MKKRTKTEGYFFKMHGRLHQILTHCSSCYLEIVIVYQSGWLIELCAMVTVKSFTISIIQRHRAFVSHFHKSIIVAYNRSEFGLNIQWEDRAKILPNEKQSLFWSEKFLIGLIGNKTPLILFFFALKPFQRLLLRETL